MSGPPIVDRLTSLIEPSLEAMGFALWRVSLVGGSQSRTLQVMAEPLPGPDGATRQITIDECAEISRTLSAVLDVEDPISGKYRLEVSSPGIDRPLVRPEHFARYVGCEARVELMVAMDGRKRFRGEIVSADEETVTIAQDGEAVALPFARIEKAKLVLTDELIAREGRAQAVEA